MKFTVALVTLALTVAGASAQTTGMSLNSHGHGHGHDDHGHHKHDPNESPIPTPYRPSDVTDAACSSSVIAQLIGISALNCASINILSTPGKRDEPFKRTDIVDPVLEDLKARHGFAPRGICESSVSAKLIAAGILECGKVSVLSASPDELDPETCTSSEVSLLASVGILNCPTVSVLSAPGKRDVEARRKEEAHKALIKRVLQVRQCSTSALAQLISADLLGCANVSVLSTGAPAPAACTSDSTAQLIDLAAGNCDTINILSAPAGAGGL